jgi:hypothetical protein
LKHVKKDQRADRVAWSCNAGKLNESGHAGQVETGNAIAEPTDVQQHAVADTSVATVPLRLFEDVAFQDMTGMGHSLFSSILFHVNRPAEIKFKYLGRTNIEK